MNLRQRQVAKLPHDLLESDPGCATERSGDTRPGNARPPAANVRRREIRLPISVTVAIDFQYTFGGWYTCTVGCATSSGISMATFTFPLLLHLCLITSALSTARPVAVQ